MLRIMCAVIAMVEKLEVYDDVALARAAGRTPNTKIARKRMIDLLEYLAIWGQFLGMVNWHLCSEPNESPRIQTRIFPQTIVF